MRLVQRRCQYVHQGRAVEFAGELVEFSKLHENAFTSVPRFDDAHGAVRALRLSVGAGKPAAGVLDPGSLFDAALESVLHLIGDAVAGIALAGLLDRIDAALAAIGVGAPRKAGAAGKIADVGDAEHRGGVAAPGQRVGVETPFIGGVADRPQDFRGVRDIGGSLELGHARPFLERHAVPGVALSLNTVVRN